MPFAAAALLFFSVSMQGMAQEIRLNPIPQGDDTLSKTHENLAGHRNTSAMDDLSRMPYGSPWRMESSHQQAGNGQIESHGHNSGKETIIHVTDHLYRVPEIRDAYDAFLELKKSQAGLPELMQSTPVYEVGDIRTFKVYNFEESNGGSATFDDVEFELHAVGEWVQIWVETEEFGPGKIDDEVVSAMLEALEVSTPSRSVNPDQGIIQNNIDIFAMGDPANVPNPSGSGMIKFLITDIQDDWTPDSNGGYVAGFFNPGDFTPRSANPNSNEAAVLYIDSRPGIYGFDDDGTVDPRRPLGTVAHEFQHLLQAYRDSRPLITFMDEGQSELAEILNGFNARNMQFLNMPDELSGNVESGLAPGFLRWRTGEPEVLFDYQRAQLFHSYLYERVGLKIGALTQQPGSRQPWVLYQTILNELNEGLEFTEVLSEFYVTNWLNPERHAEYSYSLPQMGSVRVNEPGREFGLEDRPWVRGQRVSLQYGSANYIHWPNVDDIWIEVDSPAEIFHYVISKSSDGSIRVDRLQDSYISLSGGFRSVALVSINTLRVPNMEYGTRQFTYTADWTPDSYRMVTISNSGPSRFFVEVPDYVNVAASPDPVALNTITKRIDSEAESILQSVEFPLLSSTEIEAVSGTGTLRVSVADSRQMPGIGSYVPDNELGYVDVDFSELGAGLNHVDLSGLDITLQEGERYHISLEVRGDDEESAMYFLVDEGSENENNPDYYPVRTLLKGVDHGGNVLWLSLRDNNNLVMNTRVLQEFDLPDEYPEIVESDRFEILSNYPNPFNTATRIEFNIPEHAEGLVPVRVDVFDITGRYVTTLTNRPRPAGKYTLTFNADNYASGVYIVRMLTHETIDSHKIMLVK
ncbi:T9SS type A sorting domain-containing protein [Balneolales bacterium ANBcel1]|nr:T9SS type A sorting domain-containing protein [Balneolales bacterium ANBcel1]